MSWWLVCNDSTRLSSVHYVSPRQEWVVRDSPKPGRKLDWNMKACVFFFKESQIYICMVYHAWVCWELIICVERCMWQCRSFFLDNAFVIALHVYHQLVSIVIRVRHIKVHQSSRRITRQFHQVACVLIPYVTVMIVAWALSVREAVLFSHSVKPLGPSLHTAHAHNETDL